MNKERRLGRGLEALLGKPIGDADHPQAPTAGELAAANLRPTTEPDVHPVTLNVYAIEANPFQPRQEFDEASIEELAGSLREHGLIQPIVIRQVEGRYQLISGERRLRAAIKAGWTEIQVQVREANDRQVAEIAIVENLQRKDLGPLEKAISFQQYIDRYHSTNDELAARLSVDRSTVANLIRLLELPRPVQEALRAGRITQGHARALLPLGDEREQLTFCERIASEGLSVRATEEAIQELIRTTDSDDEEPAVAGSTKNKKGPRRSRSSQIASLEQDLRRALGTRVDVKQTSAGRGKIVIHFGDVDEFERLFEHLGARPAQKQVG